MTTTWRYQHDSGTVTAAYPTDLRGLKFRAQCGYTHVHMGWRIGWLQIAIAIRRVGLEERMAVAS